MKRSPEDLGTSSGPNYEHLLESLREDYAAEISIIDAEEGWMDLDQVIDLYRNPERSDKYKDVIDAPAGSFFISRGYDYKAIGDERRERFMELHAKLAQIPSYEKGGGWMTLSIEGARLEPKTNLGVDQSNYGR